MQVGVPVHEAGGELPDGRGGAAGGGQLWPGGGRAWRRWRRVHTHQQGRQVLQETHQQDKEGEILDWAVV